MRHCVARPYAAVGSHVCRLVCRARLLNLDPIVERLWMQTQTSHSTHTYMCTCADRHAHRLARTLACKRTPSRTQPFPISSPWHTPTHIHTQHTRMRAPARMCAPTWSSRSISSCPSSSTAWVRAWAACTSSSLGPPSAPACPTAPAPCPCPPASAAPGSAELPSPPPPARCSTAATRPRARVCCRGSGGGGGGAAGAGRGAVASAAAAPGAAAWGEELEGGGGGRRRDGPFGRLHLCTLLQACSCACCVVWCVFLCSCTCARCVYFVCVSRVCLWACIGVRVFTGVSACAACLFADAHARAGVCNLCRHVLACLPWMRNSAFGACCVHICTQALH